MKDSDVRRDRRGVWHWIICRQEVVHGQGRRRGHRLLNWKRPHTERRVELLLRMQLLQSPVQRCRRRHRPKHEYLWRIHVWVAAANPDAPGRLTPWRNAQQRRIRRVMCIRPQDRRTCARSGHRTGMLLTIKDTSPLRAVVDPNMTFPGQCENLTVGQRSCHHRVRQSTIALERRSPLSQRDLLRFPGVDVLHRFSGLLDNVTAEPRISSKYEETFGRTRYISFSRLCAIVSTGSASCRSALLQTTRTGTFRLWMTGCTSTACSNLSRVESAAILHSSVDLTWPLQGARLAMHCQRQRQRPRPGRDRLIGPDGTMSVQGSLSCVSRHSAQARRTRDRSVVAKGPSHETRLASPDATLEGVNS